MISVSGMPKTVFHHGNIPVGRGSGRFARGARTVRGWKTLWSRLRPWRTSQIAEKTPTVIPAVTSADMKEGVEEALVSAFVFDMMGCRSSP